MDGYNCWYISYLQQSFFFLVYRILLTVAQAGDAYILNEARPEALAPSFAGTSILVEASYYLQQLIDNKPTQEPLLSALAGFPLSLQMHIESNLSKWKEFQITPTFIFDGQAIVGKERTSLRLAKEALTRTQAAWDLYSRNNASRAVMEFGESHAVCAETLYTFFQRILVAKGISFQIAPHNACAQIAYLDSINVSNDAILASKDVLLYPLSDTCYLTEINFEKETAYGFIRPDLIQKLGVSEETFVDALLMTGTSFLSTFPALKDLTLTPDQPYTVQSAITMFRASGRSISSLCNAFTDEIKAVDPDWKEKCLKAKMALKHFVAVHQNGSVLVANESQLTIDNHEYLGLRLPQELYHYLCSGTLRLRIVNWLSSMEIFILPPLDGGEAEEYRRLVTEQLTPALEQGLALIVGRAFEGRMNRAFQHKKVTVRYWFDDRKTITLDHMSVTPSPQSIVKTWSVKSSTYASQVGLVKHRPGSLGFGILSLRDEAFAQSTVSKEAKISNIEDKEEILTNTIWRFLHLRGYVNDEHELTVWGQALAATLESLGTKDNLDEAAFLAFELLKYDQLNARNRHEEWVGSSVRGTEEDKTHCLLIARCASLLKLRHKEIGYTGPLSKNLLSFHSIISTVRESDRDLTETVFAAMFLYAHANRNQKHWEEFGLR